MTEASQMYPANRPSESNASPFSSILQWIPSPSAVLARLNCCPTNSLEEHHPETRGEVKNPPPPTENQTLPRLPIQNLEDGRLEVGQVAVPQQQPLVISQPLPDSLAPLPEANQAWPSLPRLDLERLEIGQVTRQHLPGSIAPLPEANNQDFSPLQSPIRYLEVEDLEVDRVAVAGRRLQRHKVTNQPLPRDMPIERAGVIRGSQAAGVPKPVRPRLQRQVAMSSELREFLKVPLRRSSSADRVLVVKVSPAGKHPKPIHPNPYGRSSRKMGCVEMPTIA